MIFETFPAANWQVGASPVSYFPVCKVSESWENRLVERERPYRNGAKIDDTGSKARRWSVEVLFDNSLDEKGLSQNSKALYPDVLADMLASFDQHETGDLVLPTVGKVRARAKSYSRTEEPETYDAARVTFTFVEDNEDSVGATSFAPPGVKGSAKRLAEQTTFSAESDAVYDFNISQINELADDLETAINAPNQAMQEIDQKVGAVVAAVNQVISAFTDPRTTNPLADPDSSITQRKLNGLLDTVQRSKNEARAVKTTRVLTEFDTTLYEVSTTYKQKAATVIALNPDLDPTYVEAGSLIRILDA